MNQNLGFKTCPKCKGEATIKRFPFCASAAAMVKQQNLPCEECNGKGEIFVVPDGYCLVLGSDYKKIKNLSIKNLMKDE